MTTQDDQNERLVWSQTHRLAARRQGWELAVRDGVPRIQRVDNRAQASADHGLQLDEVPQLIDDEAALNVVLSGALSGESTCRLSIRILNNSDLFTTDEQTPTEDHASVAGSKLMDFAGTPPDGYAPLPRRIYDEAQQLGVTAIQLDWSGGSDEGYLVVGLIPDTAPKRLADAIEQWAWETIDYSGAGDGSDYGDHVTYDLVNNTVTHEGWYNSQVYDPSRTAKLTVDDDVTDQVGESHGDDR